jgi:hypothetical protein
MQEKIEVLKVKVIEKWSYFKSTRDRFINFYERVFIVLSIILFICATCILITGT